MITRLQPSALGCLVACALGAGCSSGSQLTVKTYTSSADQISVNSHLIFGDTEAILIDGQLLKGEAQNVVAMVNASGKKLTTIFVTHAHPDHYAGLDVIHQAFPSAAIVTSADVLADYNNVAPATFQGIKAAYGPLIADNLITPTALTSDTLTVDGQQIKIFKYTGGESTVSAVLYAPSIGAVFAGDHLYGNAYLFIADCMTTQWQSNIDNLPTIAATINKYYPGHGTAGGAEILSADKQYITDVVPILGADATSDVTIAAIKAKYPSLSATGILGLSVPRYQLACNPATQFALPDAAYYPESLNASADGTLYVGSLGTGQVQKFLPGSTTPVAFLPAGGAVKGVTGVLVDEAGGSLWLCAIDPTFVNPAGNTVKRYGLADGTLKATYALANGAANLCNDMTLDAQGNLFVADSMGKIHKIAKGAATSTVWSSDAILAPSVAMGFGADGITFDGTSNLYVNTFSDSRLVRIPINGDGSAGTPVQITVTPALQNPDGMRQIDANTLLVAEGGAGRVSKVSITGTTATTTAVKTGLDSPTSVVQAAGRYYISEGQVGHLTGQVAGPPNMPFKVRVFKTQ